MTQAHKLACMPNKSFCEQTHILAKLCLISKMKVSMASREYFPHVWTYFRSCEGAKASEEAEGLPKGPKAPKNPSAGARKEGAWAPRYSSIIK